MTAVPERWNRRLWKSRAQGPTRRDLSLTASSVWPIPVHKNVREQRSRGGRSSPLAAERDLPLSSAPRSCWQTGVAPSHRIAHVCRSRWLCAVLDVSQRPRYFAICPRNKKLLMIRPPRRLPTLHRCSSATRARPSLRSMPPSRSASCFSVPRSCASGIGRPASLFAIRGWWHSRSGFCTDSGSPAG